MRGKALGLGRKAPVYLDHPRRCGEKTLEMFKRQQEQGSPPQVRGKVDDCPVELSNDGITPAGAGKSNSRSMYAVYRLGSPPQVRGKD